MTKKNEIIVPDHVAKQVEEQNKEKPFLTKEEKYNDRLRYATIIKNAPCTIKSKIMG